MCVCVCVCVFFQVIACASGLFVVRSCVPLRAVSGQSAWHSRLCTYRPQQHEAFSIGGLPGVTSHDMYTVMAPASPFRPYAKRKTLRESLRPLHLDPGSRNPKCPCRYLPRMEAFQDQCSLGPRLKAFWDQCNKS